ncbi:spinster family MFS transporter [Pseudohalioglobus lutimaris]|nr:MFS transporter [Pseudohalioglobus lutimaris]
MFLLWLTYILNFVDRQLMTILLEPIKLEFGASDTAMGFLSGFAFALFYASLGVPVARLADRWSRRNVIAISVGLWSAMTAVCGLAGSFWQLALARVGVGIGEAGGTPPSHSLIADYFPLQNRATALSIHATATQFGILIGMLGGAVVAAQYGWRMAFILFGIPGVIVALLVAFTVKEPVRESPLNNSSMLADIKHIWALPGFSLIATAGATTALAAYGLGTWSPSFLIRTHGLSLVETGLLLGGAGALSGIIGAVTGGILCDRLSKRDKRWQLWLPAGGAFATAPLMLAFLLWPESQQFTVGDYRVPVAIIFTLLGGVVAAFWLGPTYAAIQTLSPGNMRAQAAAIFLFMFNLVGMGLGPLVIGVLSDVLEPGFGVDSLRYAMAISLSLVLLGGVLFLRAAPRYVTASSAA